MADLDDVDRLIEQYQRGLDEFMKGDPKPVQELFSHRDDVTLANPLVGPPARGWEQVVRTTDHAASQLRDGEVTGYEMIAKHVTPELAYVVWMESQHAKVGGRQDVTPFTLRVTMIFRPEDGTWKVVHRHADPLAAPQTAESMIRG